MFPFARDIGAMPTLLGVLLMVNCAAEGAPLLALLFFKPSRLNPQVKKSIWSCD